MSDIEYDSAGYPHKVKAEPAQPSAREWAVAWIVSEYEQMGLHADRWKAAIENMATWCGRFAEVYSAALRAERDDLRELHEAAKVELNCQLDWIAKLQKERDELQHKYKTDCIVEIASENYNVAEYVRHWEGRAEKAESDLAAVRAQCKRVGDNRFEPDKWPAEFREEFIPSVRRAKEGK